MTKEEFQDMADSYGLYTEKDVKNRLSCELLSIGARNEELEKENADLKAYNEKLLNGDIEKHNKIVELETQIEKMKCCHNCKYYTPFNDACRVYGYFSYHCDLSEWEMKENG